MRTLDGAVEASRVLSIESLADAAGRIEFRDVSFVYPGTTAPVLRNVSLSVGSGERLALVDPTAGLDARRRRAVVDLLEDLALDTSISVASDDPLFGERS